MAQAFQTEILVGGWGNGKLLEDKGIGADSRGAIWLVALTVDRKSLNRLGGTPQNRDGNTAPYLGSEDRRKEHTPARSSRCMWERSKGHVEES